MNGSAKQTELQQRAIAPLLMAAVVLGLLGLPAAVWLDLRELSERMLRTQAREISRIIDDMRASTALMSSRACFRPMAP
jgi:adenylate cyclase